jgi:hypothetical protein
LWECKRFGSSVGRAFRFYRKGCGNVKDLVAQLVEHSDFIGRVVGM